MRELNSHGPAVGPAVFETAAIPVRRTLRKRNLKEFGRSTQSRTEINGFGDRRVAVYTMLLRMHVVGLAPTKSVDA